MKNQNQKSGIAGLVIGISAGITAVAASCLAACQVIKEIKNDSNDTSIVSPNGENCVTITCGSSAFARGLTLVKVKAENEKDDCSFSFLVSKKDCKISFDWLDDNNIDILIGEGSVKKVCSVSFGEEEITMQIFFKKETSEVEEEAAAIEE